MALLLAAPAAATVYLAFNEGGFFPATPAFLAIVTLQLLVLRTLLADRPFEGIGAAAGIAAAGLAGLAVWQLLSATWSDSSARALVEFDRTLLYLTTFVLFASLGRSFARTAWLIRGLAAAMVVICGIGLVSRVLPDVLTVENDLSPDRLSYPITYWNAEGLLAAIAMILCLHLTCSGREPRVVRALAAAAFPVLAATLILTYSRGGIVVALLGLVAYAVLGRPRTLLSGLVAVVPFTALTAVVTYGADQLGRDDYVTAGVSEGHDVASVVIGCMLAAAVVRAVLTAFLDPRLVRSRIEILSRVPVPRRVLFGGAAVVAVVVIVATGTPSAISRQYDRFVEGSQPTGSTRDRLTDASSTGRIEQWNVALDGWKDAPLAGSGAGMFQLDFYRDREDADLIVTDGHSLYLETLDELGLVGLVLLLAALIAIVAAAARGLPTQRRSQAAAVLSAVVAWILAAGIDWHWEMPVVTVWLFALGGVAAARPLATAAATARPTMGSTGRATLAIGWLVAAIAPLLVMTSGTRIAVAGGAFAKGDCQQARAKSLDAIDYLAARPEPYAIVGFCALASDFPEAAVDALRKAHDRDPKSWEYQLGLATAIAATGADPGPQIREALRNNPHDPLVQSAARQLLAARSPAARRRAARRVYDETFYSYRLTVQNL
ncbi:MAG TPA: O-antigen ligase family protein [Solirubrobacteraceae bacterium]